MAPARQSALAAVLLAGCASSHPPASPVPPASAAEAARSEPALALPAPPRIRGPLALRVAYPAPSARIEARDSTFLYGSVGTGDATLMIDGAPVRVWPNGAWIAWVALPPDSVARLRLVARTATDSATLEYPVRRARWEPPAGPALWLDTLSLSPTGRVWWPRGEYLTLSAHASEGADLRLRLADGTLVRLVPAVGPEPVPEAVRAFERDTAKLATPIRRDRYVGLLRGRRLGPDPGPMLPFLGASVAAVVSSAGLCATGILCPGDILPDSAWATLEAVRGGDTLRVRWPLQLALLDSTPRLVRIDDDTAGTGTTDGITPGRALPSGTYHWFFPRGTRARAIGRMNGDLRLALSPQSDAWVASVETVPLPLEPMVPAVVGSVLVHPDSDRVRIRVPVSRRAPFEVTETEREITLRIYDAVGDVNWIQYGPADTLVRAIAWDQPATREVTLTVTLARPVWGYRARWDRDDLLLEIRRPPAIDRDHPLEGRLIAVDPGHPPAGATGPTGLREAEANLAIARALKRLLEADGARVLLTRTADVPLDLWPRVDLAQRADADLLVSIHNNALPDGVNPFTNSGSSVYYNQPRSIPLARAVQDALVRRLGVRDLGIGRGDLALVRPTWMPSVLTEGLFMMLPEQEAALRSPEGSQRYAEAVREGLRRFLRERAEASP
jgi:N-acetylmuramoyl-L-alanine amidase